MTFPKQRVMDLLSRRSIEWRDVVRVVEIGSTAHGISTSDTDDDLDLTVIRIEPFEELITGSENRQSMMIRTQPDGHRSRMGDIDLNVYTLRKFGRLALKGNPSILGAIFSQRVHIVELDLEPLASRVASKRAGYAFLGYMNEQMDRWVGIRGQKNVKRPELVEAYGFDTKYAAHVVRLGLQGIEYVQTARFSMPMDEDHAIEIRSLRTGGYDEPKALEWAENIQKDLEQEMLKSELPDRPNVAGVDAWLVDQYDQALFD